MKNTKLLLAIATSAALLTGCQNTHGINTDLAINGNNRSNCRHLYLLKTGVPLT